MAIQTSYDERMGLPAAGTIGGSDFNTKTGIVETVAGIAAGLAVSQGAADKGVVIGGLLADFLGVSIRDVALGASVDVTPRYKNLGYISRGQIWVTPSVAVTVDDPVHYVQATGAFTNTGAIGPIVGARYVTSAAAGERALIELGAR
jgi:hypothetical protein